MTLDLQYYTEPLKTEELKFLIDKELKERAQYYKVYKVLMVVSFLFPFIGAWYRAADGAENAFSVPRFFVSCAVFLFISTFSVYMTYRVYLRNVQRDIKNKTKTIETCMVTKKLFVATSGSYYFYIASAVKLNIEVTIEDYEMIQEGDEINIEYTTYSKQYLGYF